MSYDSWSAHFSCSDIAQYLVARGLPLVCIDAVACVDGGALARIMASASTRIGRTSLEAFFDDLGDVPFHLATKLAASVTADFKPYRTETLVQAAHDRIVANLTKAAPLMLVSTICKLYPVDDAVGESGLLSEEVTAAVFLYNFLIRYMLGPKLNNSVPLWTSQVQTACLNYIMFTNRRVLPVSCGMPSGTKIATDTHFLGVPCDYSHNVE